MIETLINLFEEKENLEDKINEINIKIEMMKVGMKYKEPSFQQVKVANSRYKHNWLHDF